MAKILNKDPVTYQREREGFIRDLRQFHDARGTPFRKIPKINGHEIDLYLLYMLVTAHGGWVKVNSRSEWESFVEQFKLPKHCVNSGVGLKQIYIRFLDRYEKLHYLGEDVDRGSDDDEETRHRRWSARALHAVPLTYNHMQHNVAENLRSYNGLSVDLYKPSDYDRLALSLLSPLPNEQDFAINVCTLLSNEGKHTLRLDKCPRLVNFLLAHAGVFNHPSLRPVFEESYGHVRKHSLRHFWSDTVVEPDILELADEKRFVEHRMDEPDVLRDVAPSTSTPGTSAAGASASRASASATSTSGPSTSGTSTSGPSTSGTSTSGPSTSGSSTSGTSTSEPSTSGPSALAASASGASAAVAAPTEAAGTTASAGEAPTGMVTATPSADKPSVDPVPPAEEPMEVDLVPEEVLREAGAGPLGVDTAEAGGAGAKRKPLLVFDESDSEIFCLGRTFGTQDYFGQRVLQVAQILRNLSFSDENVAVLARNRTFLRFLLLCAGSRWNTLHQHGLEMLGNVAAEVVVEDPLADRLAAALVATVTRGLASPDRMVVVSCLEILNKLSQRDENEDIMLRYLDQKVYDQVCAYLTLHDIMLLIYTLECLYSLSSLGERACNSIVRVHGVMDTLVSLITVEAQSYGPKACILMRVVETVSGTPATYSVPPQAAPLPPGIPPVMPLQAASPMLVQARPPAPVTPQRQVTPQRIMVGPPQPAVATPVTPVQPSPSYQQQQQHAASQAQHENEQFALAWLRATFEPAVGSRIEQAEMYKQYLTACSKVGRRGVIAPLHFPRCVRSVFGGCVGPNPQKAVVMGPGGDQPAATLSFYEGIKVTQRQQQQRLLQQQLQSTPQKDCISPPPMVQSTVQNKPAAAAAVPTTAAVTAVATATTSPPPASSVVPVAAVIAKNKIVGVAKLPDPRQRISRLNGARTTMESVKENAVEGTSSGETSSSGPSAQCTPAGPSLPATPSASAGRVVENHLPSPGTGGNALRGRREPPQPPPPPLAPLSGGAVGSNVHQRLPRPDIEDSDSTGNNSLASSSGIGGSRECSGMGAGNVSSTDDGENSLTSFEGILLNGIPHSLDIDAASNDSSSKDSARSGTPQQKIPNTKSLMLADLLEKKVDKKDPPILNGALGKELRIGEKGLELVENHLEKVLKDTVPCNPQSKTLELKETSAEVGKDVSEVVRTVVGQNVNNPQEVTAPESESIAFKTVGTVTDDSLASEQLKAVTTQQTQTIQAAKRPAETDPLEEGLVEAKRMHLSSETVINGTASPPVVIKEETAVDMDCKDLVKTEASSAVSVIKTEGNPPGTVKTETTVKSESGTSIVKMEVSSSSSNTESSKEEKTASASASAANLYAALAASALEGEVDLEEQPAPPPPPPPAATSNIQLVPGGLRQVFLGQGVEGASQQQQLIVAAPRQIIVSQGQLPSSQVLITAGGQIALQQGPNATGATTAIKAGPGHQAVPVLVQTGGTPSQRAQLATVQAGQVVLSQSGSGQFILSQAPQGQVQLVASGSQGGQYIVSTTGGGQTHYVVAQPQTALVQGQTQTVLVAQTPQQQGTGTKTIIILQPQSSAAATHHQKVVVTPQGQPVVVTQVPRPILQSPAITNITPVLQPPALVPTSSTATASTSASVGTSAVKTVNTTSNPTVSSTVVIRGHQSANTASSTSASLPPQQSRIITTNPATVNVSPAVVKAVTRPVITTASSTTTSGTVQNPATGVVQNRPPTPQSPVSSPSTRSMTAQIKQTPTRQIITRTALAQQEEKANQLQARNTKSPVTTVSSPQPVQPTHQSSQKPTMPPVDHSLYLCEWRGCMRSFKSPNEVYMHACESHCPKGSEEIQCLWERCDAMKRKRFSLMTHLFDRHCNADVLRMMAVRRRQLSQSGRSEIPPPQPPPPHPGYAPNAAFHAIKRHALEFVNPKEMMDDNEGPVTKSIRLTSSLILRNLVIYSTNGRRFLRRYEPHLASVALSNVESSRTIAQVLYDMNQQSGQR